MLKKQDIYAACLVSHTGETCKNCHLASEINLISDLPQKFDALFQCDCSKGRKTADMQYLLTHWKVGHWTIPSEHSPTYHSTYLICNHYYMADTETMEISLNSGKDLHHGPAQERPPTWTLLCIVHFRSELL